MVASLAVLNAKGASLDGNTLTLTGVSPNSIVFADRPVHAAGHVLTAHFIKEWDEGIESFAKSPPKATISVFSEEGDTLPGLLGPFPPVASRPIREGLLWPKCGCELMA